MPAWRGRNRVEWPRNPWLANVRATPRHSSGWTISTAPSATPKILVELIPKIYDSERIIRVLGPDASNEQVAINRVVGDGMGGTTIINDLSFGRYDVIVESGPSFATKRVEALNNMVKSPA